VRSIQKDLNFQEHRNHNLKFRMQVWRQSAKWCVQSCELKLT
jgi:hypothetical protein